MDEETFVDRLELSLMLRETARLFERHADTLANLESKLAITQTVTVSLSDTSLFRMGIGKRVLKRELFYAKPGAVPLYSANVEVGKEHGFVEKSNLTDFSRPSLLWSIDSDFNMTVRQTGEIFATTDHCGRLEILDEGLDPVYCHAAIIYGFGRLYGFDRVTRPSLQRMEKVTFRVPVTSEGKFDLAAQRALANEYTAIQDAVEDVTNGLEQIAEMKPRADLPVDAVDLGDKQVLEDSKIALELLREIKSNPDALVSGQKLKDRLNALLS